VCCGEAAEKMVTGTIVSVVGLIKVANEYLERAKPGHSSGLLLLTETRCSPPALSDPPAHKGGTHLPLTSELTFTPCQSNLRKHLQSIS